MKNELYWQNFYDKKILNEDFPTNFASWVASTLNRLNKNSEVIKLVDLGAGNCRDASFFSSKGFEVTAIDASANISSNEFIFIRKNFLNVDLKGFNVYYLRFVVHSLTEDDFDFLLEKLHSETTSAYIFIETRSSRNITDNDRFESHFKSTIGSEHFRMLYSKQYLDAKISSNFLILESDESNEFAPFRGENPYCIRYLIKSKF